MKDAKKQASPLVQTVLALDHHFAELERIGTRILDMDLKSDSDFEQARKMMARFAEAGEGVANEVTALSKLLLEARARAEEISRQVAARTSELADRRDGEQELTEEFNALADQVRQLGEELNAFKPADGAVVTPDERDRIAVKLADVQLRLGPMITEAKRLRKAAREAKMKPLDQNADSLTQTLEGLQSKLGLLQLA